MPSLVQVLMLEKARGALAFQQRGATGDLPGAAVVGSFELGGQTPDWKSFRANPKFVERLERFMRGELSSKPSILADGRFGAGEYAYAIDLRTPAPKGDVPFHDIIGWYSTASTGRVIPASFKYNADHLLVLPTGRMSSVMEDPKVLAAVFEHVG